MLLERGVHSLPIICDTKYQVIISHVEENPEKLLGI